MTHPAADDFTAITEQSPLVDELRARIESHGPITFRAFMEAALYHPRWGYYRTSAGMTGRGGDYVTSPEVHPVFGALAGRQLADMWRLMSCPTPFDLVEHGAGSGLLARDLVAWAQRRDRDFAAALRYRIVEPAPVLARQQRLTLEAADLADRVEWCDAPPDAITGCVLSNELLDAFPVHRVVRRGDDLLEVFVAHDGGRFVDELRPLADPAIAAYFDAIGLMPGDGCYAEVNVDAPRWLDGVARTLTRGYVLTFDYGYDAETLFAPWRRDGTLLCFYRQSASSDPYQRIGRQDITSSVDFTTLRVAGEAAGLRTLGMTDQASFLMRLGINEGLAAAHDRPGQFEEYFARRNVVLALIDPGKLGRIKVLLQGRGVPAGELLGFHD
jgi:SAM-dependent MidA family methyltransferase